MFQKNLNLTYLLDFYGALLDDRQRQIMQAYYEDDLSLAEIAEDENISRQGVRHVIKKAEEQLLFLEEKLHLAADFSAISEETEKLKAIRDKLAQEERKDLRDDAQALTEVINTILSKAL